MTQVVTVGDTDYEFPDGMPDDQIRAVLKRKVQSPKLSTPKPDSMLASAAKSAAGTVAGAVTEPAKGLKDLASTVIHDPELLRGTPLESLLPGGPLAVAAGKAIAGQSVDALKRMVQPGITPIERVSHGLAAVPLVGPQAQGIGMKLGVGSTYARPTGESMSPQDQQTFGQGAGELAGNAALLGAGKAASKIGTVLAQSKAARAPALGPDAGTYQSAIEEANAALGVKPGMLDRAGKVNPGAQVLAQGIDLKQPTKQIVTQIEGRLQQLGLQKDSILAKESVPSGETLFGDSGVGGDVSHKLNLMLDDVVADASRIGDQKLVKRAQSLKDYVQDSRGKPIEDLSFTEADDLAHDLWRLRTDYLGGKKLRPLAATLERTYGLIQEALPAEVRPINQSIRDLLVAKNASELKWRAERAAGPKGPPPIKDVGTLRKVIRSTPSAVVPGPLKPLAYIAKLLERTLPGSE